MPAADRPPSPRQSRRPGREPLPGAPPYPLPYSPPGPGTASSLLRFQIDDAERVGRAASAERHACGDRQPVADFGDAVVLHYSYRFRNNLAEGADALCYVNGMNP